MSETVVLDRFFNGEITDYALINCLSALKLGKLYVALTEKACSKIKIVDEHVFSEEERDELKKRSEANRSSGIAMADEICRKYRREGRLFELALKNEYDCPAFIAAFMNSKAAAALDDTYDRLQWAGEEYILEELNDEVNGLKKAGTTYSLEVMYWAGYLYRYWHYYTNESSQEIYRQKCNISK